jgi:hypothetical protein
VQTANYLKRAGVALMAAVVILPATAADAQDSKKSDKKPASEADSMAQMMEMAKPGDHHKRLQELAGTWSYTVKWWMSPDAPPSESSGTAVIKPIMEGRFLVGDHNGKMQMPGPDGKMMDMDFKGMSLEGYDNAKQKFVAAWVDNMGTGIMNMQGTYDSATKTLTYWAEYEAVPGVKTKMREAIKITDKDHRVAEFFEDREGKEVKTMEIAYTRKT